MFRLSTLRLLILLAFCLNAPMAAADVLQVELNKALENSDRIATARQTLRAAVERIGVAKGTLSLLSTLTVSGSSAQTSTDNQSNNGNSGGGGGSDNNNNDDTSESTDVILSVRKPIYDGGVAKAETRSAMLNIERARIGLKQAEQEVLQEALGAYVALVAARDRVSLEEANVKRLEEYLKATQLRLEIGDTTATELSATKARLARARASLITAESERDTALEGYRSLMGVPPPQLDLPVLPDHIPESITDTGDAALQAGLGHRLARINAELAFATLETLTANVRPVLDFELRGRSTDSSIDMRDSEETSANLTFSMPLFPNSAVRAASRAAVADHRAAVFSERDSARKTRLDAENAQRRFLAQLGVIEAHEAELEAAILFRDGTKAEADFGLKAVLDVLDAEQDVISAEVSLLLARRDRINAGYTVLASMGRLTAEDLALSGAALIPDEEEITAPIRLRPLPTLVYPE